MGRLGVAAMSALCRGCDAALPEPLPWPGFPYCGPVCRDMAIDRIIAREMAITKPGRVAKAKAKLKPRPRPVARKRWCSECGADLPRGSKTRFCNVVCAREYLAATADAHA